MVNILNTNQLNKPCGRHRRRVQVRYRGPNGRVGARGGDSEPRGTCGSADLLLQLLLLHLLLLHGARCWTHYRNSLFVGDDLKKD